LGFIKTFEAGQKEYFSAQRFIKTFEAGQKEYFSAQSDDKTTSEIQSRGKAEVERRNTKVLLSSASSLFLMFYFSRLYS
jgi:hypothetical protein